MHQGTKVLNIHASLMRPWRLKSHIKIPDEQQELRSPLSNKAILNSYRYKFSDIVSLRNLILTKYLSNLSPFLLFIIGIGGGSTCTFTVPTFHFFLWKIFFVVDALVLLCLC